MDLGVNYKALEANWAADAAYFKSVGVNCIRPNLPSVDSPWAIGADTSGSYAYWRRMAKYFSDLGFYVTWGPANLASASTSLSMSATEWTTYRTAVLAEAAYLQAQSYNITFELGNEMEDKADGTTLTVAQMIANIGTLATDVKAVYTRGPIGYSPYDYNGTTYDSWISIGRGGLDYINVHPYCQLMTGNRGVVTTGFEAAAKMAKAFPGHVDATEFGMEATAAAFDLVPKSLKNAKMGELWQYMKTIGIGRAFVYNWVGYLNEDDDFAIKKIDGTFDASWQALIKQRR